MPYQPQPRLLSTFIKFYSLTGFQFDKLQLTNTKITVHFLWNLAVNLLIQYCLLFNDPYLMQIDTNIFANKPLFRAIDHFNEKINFSLFSAFITLYIFLFSPQIISLLSSEPLKVVYASTRPAKYIIFGMNLLFLINYSSLFQLYLKTGPVNGQFLLNWLAMYLHYFHYTFPLAMLLYIHYALNRVLSQIANQITQFSNSQEIALKIRKYAQLSRQLNSLLCPPLTAFLLSHGLDTIVCVCLFGVNAELGVFVYVVTLNAFLYVGIAFAVDSGEQLRRIIDKYNDKTNLKRALQTLALQTTTKEGTLNSFIIHSLTSPTTTKKEILSKAIQIKELSIYSDDFQVKLFNLCTVNKNFVLHYLLILLTYIVLILQTK